MAFSGGCERDVRFLFFRGIHLIDFIFTLWRKYKTLSNFTYFV